ncbi:MAG: hypothetical protein HYW23_00555 [Candidatus Aenigmarchaeota archaeon]|nr:hypothetical protein [Candidatus Aenigmarchaeota archaeon]
MIEFDLSGIGKNGKDSFFGIKLPKFLDKDLAYETGLQIGDGCLSSISLSETNKTYSVTFTGHIKEFEYYEQIVKPLIKRLYGKDVIVRKYSRDNTCQIQFRSKSVFLFKTKILGLTKSPKDSISIPSIIMDDKQLTLSCIQGIADCDFSLSFLRRNKDVRYYPKLTANMKSKILIEQMHDIIKSELGIKPTVLYNIERLDKRTGKTYTSHQIELWGRKYLSVWMEKIGFQNLVTLNKYKTWKDLGYLPNEMPQ